MELKYAKEFYYTDLTTLYNDDCVRVMNAMYLENKKVDLVITSPPYNIIRPNSTDRGYDMYKDGMTNDEYAEWLVKIFECYDKVLEKDGAILFNMSYGTENTEAMFIAIARILNRTKFTIADVITWKKKSATPNNVSHNKLTRIVENVYVFCREEEFHTFKMNKKVLSTRDTGQKVYENVFNFIESKNNDASTELNKATFSSDLVHALLDRYYCGGIVMDTFSGTATTSYACQQREIKSIGIELSRKQCEYSVERLRTTQLKMF